MKHSKTNIGIIFIFFILLWLPLIDMKFHFIKVTNTEKRELAQMPSFRGSSLSTFITDYEKYYNDNFGFRSFLIWLYNFTQVKILHTSPVQKVMIGTNGWLFYNSEAAGDSHSIDDYEGNVSFTEQDLKNIESNLEHIQSGLAKKGITFIVLVAPNKSSIYDEYLPANVRSKKGISRYDQLYERLKSNKQITSIDVKQLLLQHKNDGQLYYKTDTHWNSYGGFLAYQGIMREVQNIYPQVRPYVTSDYHIETVQGKGNDDLAEMLGLQGQFQDYNARFIPINNISLIDQSPASSRTVIKTIPGSSLPKMLVFRDSFFTAVEPFLSRNFSKSTYIWTSYDQRVVDNENPDIVVWEVVERYIDRLAK